MPSQTLTVIAMICVVALSSSLDIAAIEIELKRPLDYNYELQTVGISNILSGVTGGYTGSYIFSQTIFSLQMGIRSRLMGFTIAFLSLVFVVSRVFPLPPRASSVVSLLLPALHRFSYRMRSSLTTRGLCKYRR